MELMEIMELIEKYIKNKDVILLEKKGVKK